MVIWPRYSSQSLFKESNWPRKSSNFKIIYLILKQHAQERIKQNIKHNPKYLSFKLRMKRNTLNLLRNMKRLQSKIVDHRSSLHCIHFALKLRKSFQPNHHANMIRLKLLALDYRLHLSWTQLSLKSIKSYSQNLRPSTMLYNIMTMDLRPFPS